MIRELKDKNIFLDGSLFAEGVDSSLVNKYVSSLEHLHEFGGVRKRMDVYCDRLPGKIIFRCEIND